MILNYIRYRAKLMAFLAMAILFSLPISIYMNKLQDFWLNAAFLFYSFFFFRLFDDTWSVKFDREQHPERNYLTEKNFPKFIIFTVIIGVAYLLSSTAISILHLGVISTFILFSSFLYYLFRNKPGLFSVIPILKYPVLIFLLLGSDYWPIDAVLALSFFFIVHSHDLIEENKKIASVLALFLAGVFMLPIVLFDWIGILFVLLPLLAYALFNRKKAFKYFPILYFPVAYSLAYLYTFNLIVTEFLEFFTS